ncbi:serine hydrolase [Nocardia pseudovaccinii]|uniref:serine hydrolase n=1 Tax=Nocardia pseudovaccinii TaxID=189540 RepID=UPI003D89D02F
MPAINGHGNARSVAAVQSILACGGSLGGVRLLSQAGCDRVFEEQFHGRDRVLQRPIRWGMGYRLEGRTCSWGGWGGSLVLVDVEHHMTVSYVMNQMQCTDDNMRALSILIAAYDALTT